MDKIFIDGLRFERPREGAPEFVKGRIGIHVERLKAWLEEHGKGVEWLNADLLQSKDSHKLYFQLNQWKPKERVIEMGKTPEYPPLPEEPISF